MGRSKDSEAKKSKHSAVYIVVGNGTRLGSRVLDIYSSDSLDVENAALEKLNSAPGLLSEGAV